eukprot:4741244-Lingulodinium_polyedra.AAC.1
MRDAEDSLGHIPFCSKVQEVAVRLFNLPRAAGVGSPEEHRRRFFCVERQGRKDLAKIILFLQVIYGIYNHVARGGRD